MNLENNLRHERVIYLDLNRFAVVEKGTLVKDTVETMRRGKHHCAVVLEQEALVGIFTDRDILKKVVDSPETWDRPIETVMTSSPLTISSMDSADKGLALMDDKHFRNVPVVDQNGVVVGTLTHYGIIKYLSDHFPETVYNLPPIHDRVTRKRGGA